MHNHGSTAGVGPGVGSDEPVVLDDPKRLKRSDSINHSSSVTTWDSHRWQVAKFLEHPIVEGTLGCMIGATVVLVVVQTDNAAADSEPDTGVFNALFVLNVLHSIEMGFRIYAFGARSFFRDFWNAGDSVVVLFDILLALLEFAGAEATTRFSALRMFRIIKVGRALHTLEMFSELHLMMKGLASAMKSMFWGLVFTVVILLGWSILATQVMHPLNAELFESGAYGDCDRCGRAFKTVWQSFLTFTQQIIAGDSWGAVTVPMIETYPWTGFYFGAVLVSVNLLVINMLLAAVCDSATQARIGSMKEQELQALKAKVKEMQEAREILVRLCGEIDQDHSGNITLEELERGVETNTELRDTLTLMGVVGSDLKAVFNIMDSDSSGEVDYHEFANELMKMKSDDEHTVLGLINFNVVDIRKKALLALDSMHIEISQIHKEMLDNGQPPAFVKAQDGRVGGNVEQFRQVSKDTSKSQRVTSAAQLQDGDVLDNVKQIDLVGADTSRSTHLVLTTQFQELRATMVQHLLEIQETHNGYTAALTDIGRTLNFTAVKGSPSETDPLQQTRPLAAGGRDTVEEKFDQRHDADSLPSIQAVTVDVWPPVRCCAARRELPDEMLIKPAKQTPAAAQRV